MAGFFGLFDYTKPGKGVDTEAPPKKPFFRFFELYWRKFSRFILLNLLLFLILLPIIAIVFRYFNIWLISLDAEGFFALQGAELEEGAIIFSVFQDVLLSFPVSVPFSSPETLGQMIFMLFLGASVILYGPVMCGFTYILRNFTREEHAWLSDFFIQLKKNFKQGVVLGLLELFALSMLFLNITMQATENVTMWTDFSVSLAKIVSPFLLVIILFTRKYMYIITVTFDLPLFNIVKNSLAFAIVGLGRNLFILLIDAVFIFAIFFLPGCDLIITPFFFFAFTGFLSVFSSYPLIHKHMLLPALERKRRAEAGEPLDDEPEEPA